MGSSEEEIRAGTQPLQTMVRRSTVPSFLHPRANFVLLAFGAANFVGGFAFILSSLDALSPDRVILLALYEAATLTCLVVAAPGLRYPSYVMGAVGGALAGAGFVTYDTVTRADPALTWITITLLVGAVAAFAVAAWIWWGRHGTSITDVG